jgi:hypothetical protein
MKRCVSTAESRIMFKKRLPMSVVAVLVFLPVHIQALTVWTTHSTEKIRPSDAVRTTVNADIRAAGNEFEPFQIVVAGPATGVTATATTLTNSNGTIPKPFLYREEYMDCKNMSGPDGATGRWPDALIPDTDEITGEKRNAFPFDVPSDENRVIWVDLLVPQNATAGTYTGTVNLTSPDAGDASVTVTLTVRGFSLPSTSSLRSFFGTGYGSIQKGHGSSYGDSLFVTVKQRYHRLMLDHRITASNFDDGDPTLRTIKQRYGPLMDGTVQGRLPGAKYTSIEAIILDPARAWVDSTKKWGWFDRLFLYTCDEPPAGCAYEDIITSAAVIKAADPDFRSLVTEDIDNVITHNVESSIDLITPVINFMHDKPGSKYEGSQAANYSAYTTPGDIKELWIYQSCMSQGCGGTGSYNNGWASYMIDHAAIRHRAMPWLAFQWGATGELYYAVDYAFGRTGNDPWTNQWYFTGNGDGTLLYPGTPGKIGGTTNIPVASIRLKLIREAYEDYEYLKALSDKGQEAYARQLAQQLFPNPWTQPSPSDLFAARDSMANRIVSASMNKNTRTKIFRSNGGFFIYHPHTARLSLNADVFKGNSKHHAAKLRVSDILGRTTVALTIVKGVSQTVELPDVQAGIYQVTILCGDFRYVGMFMKIR